MRNSRKWIFDPDEEPRLDVGLATARRLTGPGAKTARTIGGAAVMRESGLTTQDLASPPAWQPAEDLSRGT